MLVGNQIICNSVYNFTIYPHIHPRKIGEAIRAMYNHTSQAYKLFYNTMYSYVGSNNILVCE